MLAVAAGSQDSAALAWQVLAVLAECLPEPPALMAAGERAAETRERKLLRELAV